MSIVDFIAVVSFGLTCFGRGYTFGKDNNKPQKIAAILLLYFLHLNLLVYHPWRLTSRYTFKSS